MSMAEIKDFGTTVMGITPEDNADFWPGRPDSLDDAFDDHHNFFTRGLLMAPGFLPWGLLP